MNRIYCESIPVDYNNKKKYKIRYLTIYCIIFGLIVMIMNNKYNYSLNYQTKMSLDININISKTILYVVPIYL